MIGARMFPVDARFANSQDETATQDAAAFNRSFAAQLGNIALVVTLVVGAAFTAILLIVGTTMALAVRERTKEVGVLKTLGFSSGRVLRMVLGESMLLSLIGGVLYTQIGHVVPFWFGACVVGLAIIATLLAVPAIRAHRAVAEASGA